MELWEKSKQRPYCGGWVGFCEDDGVQVRGLSGPGRKLSGPVSFGSHIIFSQSSVFKHFEPVNFKGSSWYLLCEDCRHRYIQQNRPLRKAFGLKGKRLCRQVSLSSKFFNWYLIICSYYFFIQCFCP